MPKPLLKKMSFLGLVLMAASVVTAAFTISKNTNKIASNGTIRGDVDNDGGIAANTCIFRQDANSCNDTPTEGELSTTTHEGETNSYDELGNQTSNNTTVGDI